MSDEITIDQIAAFLANRMITVGNDDYTVEEPLHPDGATQIAAMLVREFKLGHHGMQKVGDHSECRCCGGASYT